MKPCYDSSQCACLKGPLYCTHVHCAVCNEPIRQDDLEAKAIACANCAHPDKDAPCIMHRTCAKAVKSDFAPKPLCVECVHERAIEEISTYELLDPTDNVLPILEPITTSVASVDDVMRRHLAELPYGVWHLNCAANLDYEIEDCCELEALRSARESILETQQRVAEMLRKIDARTVALTTALLIAAVAAKI